MLTPADLSRLQALHDVGEVRRDLPVSFADPQLLNFFYEGQNR